MAIQHYQPFKAVAVVIAVAINAARLPVWLISYILPSLRPNPKWSFKQAVRVQVVKNFLATAAYIEMKTPVPLAPGSEKLRWAVSPEANPKYFVAIAKADPKIVPESMGGTWYPAAPTTNTRPGYVVLHFHGGAFVIGDGRTADAGFAAKTLLAHTPVSHVYAPQYRLSCNPNCHFPAALQDAITSYAYLIDTQGIPANKIILSGDSAGGNLVLSLVRYLTEHGKSIGLGKPAAAWLWSPWCNPSKSITSEAFDNSPHVNTDYITAAFGSWGAKAYAPKPETGLKIDDGYISSVGKPFATEVPLYISTGENEVLFHDDVELYEEFKAVKGNNVTLQIEENAVHDTILVGAIIGFEKTAQVAAKRAGDWFKTIVA
jgi:acetyl esterase/lipase